MDTIKKYELTELIVQKRLSESELRNHFEIRTNVRWRNADKYAEFDIALYRKDIVYAVVEVKTSLKTNLLDAAKRQINNALRLTNCRFGIITDNNTYFIKDIAHHEADFVKMEFDKIVQCLIKPDIISPSNGGMDSIKKALETFFVETDIISSICADIKYDDNQGFFSFSNIDKERTFFLLVIGALNSKELIYRYTTLDTLFLMMNKGTYRMSGIVGMNDKSEIDYFDKECKINNLGSSVREINDTYLSSCSTLKDDLTMWRLYGDDGKGVCLEFEVLPPEKRSGGFILAPVNYAEERRKHTALKMFKKLSDANIRFAELYKWKHFFKPYDYSVEKEIRLMFIDNGRFDNGVVNRDWVKTWSYSIINPVVDFKLNSSSFPIQLKRIIMGPKLPELNVNISQIDYLISLRGYSIEIARSEIDNYR